MPSPLRDRGRFTALAAVLGSAFGVLNLVYTVDWGWILALLMFPALIVRTVWRTMPSWLLLAWVTIPTLVGDALVVTPTAYMVIIVAVAVAAADRPRRADTIAMALCLVSPFFIWLLGTNEWYRGIGAWIWAGGLLISWGFGAVVGEQWRLIDELNRTRTRLAEAAVVDERQRIAGDLHDLVERSFTVVLRHLSGAGLILDSSPAEAADALRQAEAVGRTGMDELRQALMLMHQGTSSLVPFTPGNLDRLVGDFRDAGMQIDFTIAGDLDSIAAAPRIVLHDVIREALTNTAKHAHTPQAAIHVDVGRDRVTVTVESALGHDATAGNDIELAGLGHRVTAVGGTFHARPDREHWVVQARLPRRLAEVPA
ncbi:sensor histidine kinase [Plantactinospora sp. CA-294935]|uniref:sensor histidine kinase n=1 Tax=Plantactinospora sp. CA-294935 TaxID=3240012 RepID=UPI003D8BA5A8